MRYICIGLLKQWATQIMKKILIPVLSIMAMLTAMPSCGNADKGSGSTTDTIDSAAVAANDSDSTLSVTGIALDGAMNSVFIKSLQNGDSLSFEYPDLDRKLVDSWEIGDTVTVKYVKTTIGGEPADSVLQLINDTKQQPRQ